MLKPNTALLAARYKLSSHVYQMRSLVKLFGSLLGYRYFRRRGQLLPHNTQQYCLRRIGHVKMGNTNTIDLRQLEDQSLQPPTNFAHQKTLRWWPFSAQFAKD